MDLTDEEIREECKALGIKVIPIKSQLFGNFYQPMTRMSTFLKSFLLKHFFLDWSNNGYNKKALYSQD